jgi:hypothetical protein
MVRGGKTGHSRSGASSPADLARRKWWGVFGLALVALIGIPVFVVTFVLIDFESTRIEMRADCVERFAGGSEELQQCIDSADAWP